MLGTLREYSADVVRHEAQREHPILTEKTFPAASNDEAVLSFLRERGVLADESMTPQQVDLFCVFIKKWAQSQNLWDLVLRS